MKNILSVTSIHFKFTCSRISFSPWLQIRLAEAQQQKAGQQELKPEQLEKLSKLEGWHNELKLLEEKKADLEAS